MKWWLPFLLVFNFAQGQSQFQFVMGPSFSESKGSFGGAQYYIGIGLEKVLSPEWSSWVLLRGDSLGQDGESIKKYRIAWLIGISRHLHNWQLGIGMGVIDTLTSRNFDPNKTVIDPYTGVTLSSDESALSHRTRSGALVTASYNFYESTSYRLLGEISYANSFESTEYGSYSSVGFRVELPME